MDKEYMERLFSCLSEREQLILAARFGNPKVTFKELGKRFGVTLERIRCIQSVALRKLEQRKKMLVAMDSIL